ncbi:MAG TPA: molybdenum cofactor guanylyltransferase, partial [Clostridia bacterium]|nr:molybdenum cofactor guanylyltransferase [Clostridia bacterium]
MINSTAIILAGGKSSRMNYENKALLEYNGKTFLDIAIEKVIRFDEILIITSKFNKYNYEGIRILEDIIPDQGPLGGIYTGLKNARNNISVVLPCDTPLLDAQLLEYFLEACNGYDGVVPKVDGHYQPVCAAYTKK